jgi:hypothetical protein
LLAVLTRAPMPVRNNDKVGKKKFATNFEALVSYKTCMIAICVIVIKNIFKIVLKYLLLDEFIFFPVC